MKLKKVIPISGMLAAVVGFMNTLWQISTDNHPYGMTSLLAETGLTEFALFFGGWLLEALVIWPWLFAIVLSVNALVILVRWVRRRREKTDRPVHVARREGPPQQHDAR